MEKKQEVPTKPAPSVSAPASAKPARKAVPKGKGPKKPGTKGPSTSPNISQPPPEPVDEPVAKIEWTPELIAWASKKLCKHGDECTRDQCYFKHPRDAGDDPPDKSSKPPDKPDFCRAAREYKARVEVWSKDDKEATEWYVKQRVPFYMAPLTTIANPHSRCANVRTLANAAALGRLYELGHRDVMDFYGSNRTISIANHCNEGLPEDRHLKVHVVGEDIVPKDSTRRLGSGQVLEYGDALGQCTAMLCNDVYADSLHEANHLTPAWAEERLLELALNRDSTTSLAALPPHLVLIFHPFNGVAGAILGEAAWYRMADGRIVFKPDVETPAYDPHHDLNWAAIDGSTSTIHWTVLFSRFGCVATLFQPGKRISQARPPVPKLTWKVTSIPDSTYWGTWFVQCLTPSILHPYLTSMPFVTSRTIAEDIECAALIKRKFAGKLNSGYTYAGLCREVHLYLDTNPMYRAVKNAFPDWYEDFVQDHVLYVTSTYCEKVGRHLGDTRRAYASDILTYNKEVTSIGSPMPVTGIPWSRWFGLLLGAAGVAGCCYLLVRGVKSFLPGLATNVQANGLGIVLAGLNATLAHGVWNWGFGSALGKALLTSAAEECVRAGAVALLGPKRAFVPCVAGLTICDQMVLGGSWKQAVVRTLFHSVLQAFHSIEFFKPPPPSPVEFAASTRAIPEALRLPINSRFDHFKRDCLLADDPQPQAIVAYHYPTPLEMDAVHNMVQRRTVWPNKELKDEDLDLYDESTNPNGIELLLNGRAVTPTALREHWSYSRPLVDTKSIQSIHFNLVFNVPCMFPSTTLPQFAAVVLFRLIKKAPLGANHQLKQLRAWTGRSQQVIVQGLVKSIEKHSFPVIERTKELVDDWIQNQPPSKRNRARVGVSNSPFRPLEADGVGPIEVNVKWDEMLLKVANVGGDIDKPNVILQSCAVPRAILNVGPMVQAATGPEVSCCYKRLASVFSWDWWRRTPDLITHYKDLLGEMRPMEIYLIFGSSLTRGQIASVVSTFWNNDTTTAVAVIMVAGDDSFVLRSWFDGERMQRRRDDGDMGMFDQSQGAGPLGAENDLETAAGLPPNVSDVLSQTCCVPVQLKPKYTQDILTVKHPERHWRPTGGSNTTCGNSCNCGMCLCRCVYEAPTGDAESWTKIAKSLGFDYKSNSSNELSGGTFLKHMFVKAEFVDAWIPVPLEGRLLKLGKFQTDPRILAKEKDYVVATRKARAALAAGIACPWVSPTMAAILDRWLEFGPSDATVESESRYPDWVGEEKVHGVVEMGEFTVATAGTLLPDLDEWARLVEERYGQTPHDTATLVEWFREGPEFPFIEHPLAASWALKDYS